MFNKKNSALLLAAGALVAGGLASCGGGASGPSLSIWCPGTDESVINAIVASFKETYEDYADWNIYIDQTVGEGDTQALLVADKTTSADVICMADDNLRTAVQSNTVLPVDAADAAAIAESDGQDAVDSLSINGTLYGYPYRMDNSYLLFYDTTIYSQEDIKSLDSILKKSQEAGVDFCFDLATGWYSPSVFMANDVYQWIDQDQDGVDTILSEYYTQAGVDVAEALWSLSETYTNNGWNWTGDQGVIEGGVKEGSETPVGAAILWNDYNILKANNRAAPSKGEQPLGHGGCRYEQHALRPGAQHDDRGRPDLCPGPERHRQLLDADAEPHDLHQEPRLGRLLRRQGSPPQHDQFDRMDDLLLRRRARTAGRPHLINSKAGRGSKVPSRFLERSFIKEKNANERQRSQSVFLRGRRRRDGSQRGFRS